MSFTEQFDTYPLGRSLTLAPERFPLSTAGAWRDIVAGKSGGKAMALEGQTHAMVRGLGSDTSGRTPYVRVGFSIFLDSPGGSFLNGGASDDTPTGTILFDLIATAQSREGVFAYVRDEFGRIMSYNHGSHTYDVPAAGQGFYQIAGEVQDGQTYRIAACRVGVNSDGYLRVVKGEHDRVLGDQPDLIVARSARPIPFKSWTRVYFDIYMGTLTSPGYVYGWIDDQLVIAANAGFNFCVEAKIGDASGPMTPFALPAPNSHNDSRLVNADDRGFHSISFPGSFGINESKSAIDDLFILAEEPTSPGSPLGEIEVLDLAIIADGDVSESTIVGDDPAPTRWESVAEDDGDDTKVQFEPDQEDRYVFAAIDPGRTVLGLGVRARVKKSDDGIAAMALGFLDADDIASPLFAPRLESVDDFETIGRAFDQLPDGSPLTPAGVNDLVIQLARRI